jgi:glycosyltransferase involved in cell wall biosynthesis
MKPIAIVIPWFGEDLKGGAERLAWQMATRLAARGHEIEVLTTCCRAFLEDWATNHLKDGLSQEQGVRIRRFPVDSRDRVRFDYVNARMLAFPNSSLKPGVNPVSQEDSSIFSKENINSLKLLQYLQSHRGDYHAFVFIPYLYGPVLYGLPIVADRAFLQPCLHDEVYAYLPQVEQIFLLSKGLLFNTEGEAQLAARLYGPGVIRKSVVVGSGIENPTGNTSNISEIGSFQISHKRFVLCLGRKDPGKNTDFLARAYTDFRRKHPDSTLGLVFAGPGVMSLETSVEGIVDLGLVQENEKEALLANCAALFQPSRNESYSRVIMEAWFHGRPVAAHRRCLATATAVENAQAGWLADDLEDWAELFATIDVMKEKELLGVGANGRLYVGQNAVWDKVMDRYETVLGLCEQGTKLSAERVERKKKLTEIHQLLPGFAYGDAITNHALTIREHLRGSGYVSHIFVRYIDERIGKEAKQFEPRAINPKAGLIYHHSIGSELTQHVIKHGGPKYLIYHNITPAEFFEPYKPQIADLLRQGRRELPELAAHFPWAVGDSSFNARELAEAGFSNPGVFPISVDPCRWAMSPDPEWMNRLQDARTNLLYVGRLAPNKCQHHLIQVFSRYLNFDPSGRLLLVGGGDPNDPYVRYLHQLTRELALTNHVVIAGQLTDTQLQACYRTAHLFWSMSEHEGFCVPLVEAMWFDVPVLAYKSSAIPETLGEAALMFTKKTPSYEIAALAKLLVHENDLRHKLLQAQRRRRSAFLPEALKEHFERLVSGLESKEGLLASSAKERQ